MNQLLSRKCATPLLLMIIVGRVSFSDESNCQISLLPDRSRLSYRFGTDQNSIKVESYFADGSKQDIINCLRMNGTGNMICMPNDSLIIITDSELNISVSRVMALENNFLCHALPANSHEYCNLTNEGYSLSTGSDVSSNISVGSSLGRTSYDTIGIACGSAAAAATTVIILILIYWARSRAKRNGQYGQVQVQHC